MSFGSFRKELGKVRTCLRREEMGDKRDQEVGVTNTHTHTHTHMCREEVDVVHPEYFVDCLSTILEDITRASGMRCAGPQSWYKISRGSDIDVSLGVQISMN